MSADLGCQSLDDFIGSHLAGLGLKATEVGLGNSGPIGKLLLGQTPHGTEVSEVRTVDGDLFFESGHRKQTRPRRYGCQYMVLIRPCMTKPAR